MGIHIYERMAAGKMPPMIWVMLDEHLPTGTHEFADSVNDGPWGTALTQEYIPWLESDYRMLEHVADRFLQGHSSGGWATLQLQVNYPRVFGGTWSTSPDPSDFHDFTGIDLYAPHANVYRRPDGTPYPLVRMQGKVVASFEQFAKLEEVLGPYGGQMASFDWVFSPRSSAGTPEPMFDRTTGDVDPRVIAYWRTHYDLAQIVQATWAQQGRYLKGKIHVYVGTADTFYLDGRGRQPGRRPEGAPGRCPCHLPRGPQPLRSVRQQRRSLRTLRHHRGTNVSGGLSACGRQMAGAGGGAVSIGHARCRGGEPPALRAGARPHFMRAFAIRSRARAMPAVS